MVNKIQGVFEQDPTGKFDLQSQLVNNFQVSVNEFDHRVNNDSIFGSGISQNVRVSATLPVK